MAGILPKGIGRRENSACRYCKSGTSWTRRRSRWIERVANWYRMCLPMEPSSHIIFWWISFGRVESGSSESAYRIATSPKVHYRIALDWLRHFHEHTKKKAKKKKNSELLPRLLLIDGYRSHLTGVSRILPTQQHPIWFRPEDNPSLTTGWAAVLWCAKITDETTMRIVSGLCRRLVI